MTEPGSHDVHSALLRLAGHPLGRSQATLCDPAVVAHAERQRLVRTAGRWVQLTEAGWDHVGVGRPARRRVESDRDAVRWIIEAGEGIDARHVPSRVMRRLELAGLVIDSGRGGRLVVTQAGEAFVADLIDPPADQGPDAGRWIAGQAVPLRSASPDQVDAVMSLPQPPSVGVLTASGWEGPGPLVAADALAVADLSRWSREDWGGPHGRFRGDPAAHRALLGRLVGRSVRVAVRCGPDRSGLVMIGVPIGSRPGATEDEVWLSTVAGTACIGSAPVPFLVEWDGRWVIPSRHAGRSATPMSSLDDPAGDWSFYPACPLPAAGGPVRANRVDAGRFLNG